MLFALIFVWTPPHFWALAIRYRDDYRSVERADDAGRDHASSAPRPRSSATPCWWRPCRWCSPGPPAWARSTGSAPSVLGVVFCGLALQLWRDPTEARAMRLFHWSITYVTLLFGAMAVDQLIFH